MLLLKILYILGIGPLIGILIHALIYCLTILIRGTTTWKDDN